MKTWDAIVIGAGIIGLSVARELHRRGMSVLVVEKGEAAREASYAAAGMLVASVEESPPALRELASTSAEMYPEFVHELEDESQSKVDFRQEGTIVLQRAGARVLGASSNTLTSSELRKREMQLEAEGYEAVMVEEASVNPRALSEAALTTCKHRGVDTSLRDEVVAVEVVNGRAAAVRTTKTGFAAGLVVNCAGAWAGKIPPCSFPTRPVKGQMLAVAMRDRNVLRHVVRAPEVYLVPRSSGRLLIGATVEEAGYDKRTDADTIHRMHRAALELLPVLEGAKILEDWAGLRPGTPDGLPILGQTRVAGYFVATGHFRDGILLAPVTAKIIGQVVCGEKAAWDIAAFSPDRFER
jgi:glycine oxidase